VVKFSGSNLVTIKFENKIILLNKKNTDVHANTLKFFLSMLKNNKINPFKSFTYIETDQDYLPSIEIKDYLGLHISGHYFLEQSLFKTKCEEMYKLAINSHHHISELDERSKKLLEFYKAFTTSSKYIICDLPESHLNQEDIELVKEIMYLVAKDQNKTILLATNDEHSWLNIATHFCEKNENRIDLISNELKSAPLSVPQVSDYDQVA
jgi:ABC-type lipoprotein export system ATPase subunit